MGGRLGDIIVILIVALVLFGGNKLPEIGRALGSALSEFKNAVNRPPEPPSNQPNPNQPMQPALAAATPTPAVRRTRRSPARKNRSKSSR